MEFLFPVSTPHCPRSRACPTPCSTSLPLAAPRSIFTVSRSAAAWRMPRASPNPSAAARPISPSGRPGSACARRVITRVGDEAFGRFIREQLTREGVDVTGVATDPEAPHCTRHSRRARSQHLPADLLSRGLRRRRARRDRHRRSLHPQRLRDRRHRHAFRAGKLRRRPAQGDAHRHAKQAAGSSSTSTTAPIFGASPAMAAATSAISPPTRSASICKPSFPIATSSSAPRRRCT